MPRSVGRPRKFSDEDLKRMRRLRSQDGIKRKNLAIMFDCSIRTLDCALHGRGTYADSKPETPVRAPKDINDQIEFDFNVGGKVLNEP